MSILERLGLVRRAASGDPELEALGERLTDAERRLERLEWRFDLRTRDYTQEEVLGAGHQSDRVG